MRRSILRVFAAVCAVVTLLPLSACGNDSDGDLSDSSSSVGSFFFRSPTVFDSDDAWDDDATRIELSDASVHTEGTGVTVSGSTVTVVEAGTYRISGRLSDGQIAVRVGVSEKVHLIFEGCDITCSFSAAVWLREADKVTITLAEGTENRLCDTGVRALKDSSDGVCEVNACLYAETDLSLNGLGSLSVIGTNNGIATEKDLCICGGTLSVTAGKNALKAANSVLISDGVLDLKAEKDGIKTTKTVRADKGWVLISGGKVTVTAKDDGIQSATDLTVSGGDVTLYAVDRKLNCGGVLNIDPSCVR